MDNFFKQFQDNLENRPEPAFEEKDWLALEKQLPPQRESRPLSNLLFWGLAPLLLCSLAANWFFYHQIKNTKQQMAVLNSRFETVNSKTIVIQTDTIYKFHTIVQRDTIYKTRVVRETVVSYLPPTFEGFQKNNLTNLLSNTPLNLPFNSTENILNHHSNDNALLFNQTDSLNYKPLIINELDKLNALPLSFLKIKATEKK